MHIAIISPKFPSVGRPVYVFVQQLVFALVDQGVKVSVIAPQSLTHAIVRHERILEKHSICKTNLGNTFDVYRPYDVSFGNKLKKIASIWSMISNKCIFKILNKIAPDVLYGHFWDSAYRVKDYALMHNLPLFVACGEGDNALEELVERLSKADKSKLVKAVTGMISVSSENKRKCIKYELIEEKNVVVLPNCVDTSIIYPRNGMDCRKKYGLNKNDFFILFVGVFNHRKGPSRLASAITKLNDKNIKVAFVGTPQIGKGDDPICNGIIYKGKMEHKDIAEIMACADVFILPTLKEGCSNAIVEALATGVPVISSDGPFNDDILNGNNSIRVNPLNVDDLAAAIEKLKNNKELSNRMKNYTLTHSNDFSITNRAAKIIGFIEKQMNNEKHTYC